MLSSFSRVGLFVTPWTVAHQVPLSMGFSRQEYWSRLPCSPPGDLPDSGIEPLSLYVSCIGRRVLYHQCHLGRSIQRLYFLEAILLKIMKNYISIFPMNLTQIMADTMCFLVLYIYTYIDMETHLTLHCTKHTLYYAYFCIQTVRLIIHHVLSMSVISYGMVECIFIRCHDPSLDSRDIQPVNPKGNQS